MSKLLFVAAIAIAAAGCNCDSGNNSDGGAGGGSAGGIGGGTGGGGTGGGSGGGGVGGGTGGGAGGGGGVGGGVGGGAGGGTGGGTSCGAALFTGLGALEDGGSSFATALSRDGTTVVGAASTSSGGEAVRWRAETGMIGLGDLPGGPAASLAYGVSADGTVVTGTSGSSNADCAGRTDEAFRWTPDAGMIGLGDDPAGCFFSASYAVSADGTVAVGGATNALSNTAASWSLLTQSWTDYGLATAVDNSSSLAAVTPDLAFFAGTYRLDATTSYRAIRLSAGGGLDLIGDLDGGALFAAAQALSDDGATVVGFGTSALGQQAFVWTPSGGIVALDNAGPGLSTSATCITGDGALIGGQGESDAGSRALVWNAARTPALLSDLLVAHAVTVPSGWRLESVAGVTVDAGVVSVCGTGTNPSGQQEAWLARYCAP